METLNVQINSQGLAVLSIDIFSKEENFSNIDGPDGGNLDIANFNFNVTENETFTEGFVESITPQPNTGSEYIAYKLVAKGVIC
jgi:hypothetical protein